MTEAIVYSSPHCKACDLAKAYLRERRVPYNEIDVSQDDVARDALLRLTCTQSLPVVQIGGCYVVGFSRRQLDQLLETRRDVWQEPEAEPDGEEFRDEAYD